MGKAASKIAGWTVVVDVDEAAAAGRFVAAAVGRLPAGHIVAVDVDGNVSAVCRRSAVSAVRRRSAAAAAAAREN